MEMFMYNQVKEMSWIELKQDYKESRKNIAKYIDEEKQNINSCKANLEISNSMKRELENTIKELEKRCLYEFNTASEDSILKAILTDRQREVVQLRQNYSVSEIGKKLALDRQAVFQIYKQALVNIEKYLNAEDKELSVLSPQQIKIHNMIKLGKTNSEIMQELNMKRNALHMQIKRIEKKLKLVSTKLYDKH